MSTFFNILIVVLTLALTFNIIKSDFCKKSVCEYNWEITEWITGMYGAHIPVWSVNSTYYYLNESDNMVYQVPSENYTHILGLDGFQRIIPLINGAMPGPTIEVYEGTEIIVHLTNHMANEATSIHWHGLYQKGTPWMDGVSTVTQCAIVPGDTFTYRFIADPIGTHWYHSHHGLQRPDGLFGALIIHERNQTNLHQQLCGNRQSVLMVNDWFHQHNEDILLRRIGPAFRSNGTQKPSDPWTFNIAGKIASETPFRSILFNGKGRMKLNQPNMETPLEYIRVSTDSTHCIRLIHSGMERTFQISIDQHKFILISSDGFDITPSHVLDSLIITPGETYDFYINTTHKIDNYWIRAKTLEIESNNEGWAVLQYNGAPNDTLPTTKMNTCIRNANNNNLGCLVANCPFPIMPVDSNQTCLHITNFTNYNVSDNVINYEPSKSVEYFLNFEFGPLGVNRRAYVMTSSPLLTQFTDAVTAASFKSCNASECDYHGCNCTHILDIPFNYSVQMIFTNIGRYAAAMHPIHLHGHSFQILRIGFPSSYNKSSGRILSNFTSDIECMTGTDCAVKQWAVDYNTDILPYLQIKQPVRKDTMVVMPGGYVVVRWISNNPGIWHLHCHMTQHLYWGLGMVIAEAAEYSDLFPPPPGFPKCGNFDYTDQYMKQSIAKYDKLWNN